ncbi:hypothetical protein [Polyangium sp. y55x31]|uniref:hypothetical protein n=1 Tax=Polyangium sp. y55x31 TaxID=3042688 RepID=UPI002482AE1D|nr:hypothetical protein [Polyangium sp. y55x31]MDI1483331.1 hypothetical protein [Polyangium sp. y55x31]
MARDPAPRRRLLFLALGSLVAGCGPSPAQPSQPAPRSANVAATTQTGSAPSVCPDVLAETAPDRGWFALGASAPSSSATPAPNSGIVSPTAGTPIDPVAMYDAEGRLVVAWAEAPGVRWRRLEGAQFRDLPSIPAKHYGGFPEPMLTRDAQGRVLLYFFEEARVRVFRLDGANVQDLSPKTPPPAREFGIPGPPRAIACPAVAWPSAPSRLVVGGDGRPIVGWAEAGLGAMKAVVHRWTGAAWVSWSFPDIGPVDFCAPSRKSITLAADPKGHPYISFQKDRAVIIAAWNGSAFRVESTLVPEHDATYMSDPRLAFGPKNVRFHAWNEQITQNGVSRERVHVWRSDEKGSRILKQPADRPLVGQIVAFGGGDRPRIAVLDRSGPRPELRFVAWDNEVPVELTGGPGGADFMPANTHGFPVAALPEGSAPPAVVYRGRNEIAVRVWSAGSYHAPGAAAAENEGLGQGVAEGVPPAIAMRRGKVAVAWLGSGATPAIVVRRWTGCAWETAPALPPETGRPGAGYRPAIALDAEGRVLLAYSTANAAAMVAARWAGAAWELLPAPNGTVAPGGDPVRQALAVGVEVEGTGTPVFAWTDRTKGTFALARLESSGIRLISSDRGPIFIPPSMTTDGAGRVVVGMLDHTDRDPFVGYTRRLEGDRFVDLPPWTSPPRPVNCPAEGFELAAGASGEVALAFRCSPAVGTYVALFKGSSWTTIAAPGTAGAGDLPGPGGNPAITFDDTGGLRLAYSDNTSGEILVKRFVGSAWSTNEVGASPGDSVSRSDAASVDPAIAASGGAVCVAWTERDGGEGRVLLRCRR